MSVSDDSIDAILADAMKSLEISSNGVWPAYIYSSREVEGEIIANLDDCFLPPDCMAWLPFPMPKTADNSIELHVLAKALDIVAHLPLFAVFSICTPILMLISSGIPSRQKIYDCDETILRLRRIFNEDAQRYDGNLRDFAKLTSSRLIIDKVMQLQLTKMSHERAALSTQYTHTWPKHVSTFAALQLYNTMIITILSLAVAQAQTQGERERLNACHRELDEKLKEAFAEIVADPRMQYALKKGHYHLEDKFNVYDLLVPDELVDMMRSYTYRVLELFERCVMTMLQIPSELQSKLVCTCQRRLSKEDEEVCTTPILLEEQAQVIRARCDFNARIWSSTRVISDNAASKHIYLRRPYHEWVMMACIRCTLPVQHARKNADYLRRVLLGTTTMSDGDWASIHFNYDEKSNSIFRSVR